jgi:hypothetical protein
MAKSAPTIDLCYKGKTFPVEIAVLLEQCSLFRDSPRLLGSSEYQISSKVHTGALAEFVKCLRGDPYSLDPSTVSGLSKLSEEFGFAALSAACSSFRDDRSTLNADYCSELILRLSALEERQQSLEKQIEDCQDEIGRLRGVKQSSLERQVDAQHQELSRLREAKDRDSHELSDLRQSQEGLESSVAVLRRDFEKEVRYRRGCEYFYGTNGYGDRGLT